MKKKNFMGGHKTRIKRKMVNIAVTSCCHVCFFKFDICQWSYSSPQQQTFKNQESLYTFEIVLSICTWNTVKKNQIFYPHFPPPFLFPSMRIWNFYLNNSLLTSVGLNERISLIFFSPPTSNLLYGIQRDAVSQIITSMMETNPTRKFAHWKLTTHLIQWYMKGVTSPKNHHKSR